MVKYIQKGERMVLQRQTDEQIMRGVKLYFSFLYLTPRIGTSSTLVMDRGFSESNRGLFAEVLRKVEEFYRTYGHPVGMIRWDREGGTPGGLSKARIQLRTKLTRQELEELHTVVGYKLTSSSDVSCSLSICPLRFGVREKSGEFHAVWPLAATGRRL